MKIEMVRIFIPDACEGYTVGENGVRGIFPIFKDSVVVGVKVIADGGLLEFYNTPMCFTRTIQKDGGQYEQD